MGRSIGWSAIGVDGEERRRKEGEGKRQGKDRKKTGERQGKRQDFARLLTPKQAVWAKNSIFLA